MSDFRDKLRAPYQQQQERMRALKEAGEADRASCRDEVNAWPLLADHVQKETLPAWEERIGRLDERMQPLDLKQLFQAIRRLNALPRLTWRIPAALRIRMLNFFYRGGIFTVRLFQLALVLAVCYLLLRLIWWLA